MTFHLQPKQGLYIFLILIITLIMVSVLIQSRILQHRPFPAHADSQHIQYNTEQRQSQIPNHTPLKMADIVVLFDDNHQLYPHFPRNDIAFYPSKTFVHRGPPAKDVFWPNNPPRPFPARADSRHIQSNTEQRRSQIPNQTPLKMADIVVLFDDNHQLSPHFPRNNITFNPAWKFVHRGPPVKDVFWPNNPQSDTAHRWQILAWSGEYLLHANDCPYSNCWITHDRRLLNTSDAVIFHFKSGWSLIRDQGSFPQRYSPHQRFVYFGLERPWHSMINITDRFNNIFNWTAGFRLDTDVNVKLGFTANKSDICWDGNIPIRCKEMGKSVQNGTPIRGTLSDSLEILKKKTRLAVARISNCGANVTNRVKYVKELQKYMKVDFFGGCGTSKCPKSDQMDVNPRTNKKRDQECDDALMSQYKFYLAFENSNCRDYITEKFWYPLVTWYSIPVAMGGVDARDYIRVAPPNSFIHVSQFSSPKQLAEYLTLLDKDDSLYLRYQKWREEYSVHRNVKRSFICYLCEKLNDGFSPVQTYTDLHGWYKQDVCGR